MSGFLLRLRSRWEPREWPRHREGAVRDERDWIDSLNDRELADLCAALGQVDKAVKDFRAQRTEPQQENAE
jgi:hypothetical protein